MDRATVRKRLRHVAPDGRVQGFPAWKLGTALAAIRGERKPEDDPDAVPPCIRSLGGPFTCDASPPNVVSEAIALALQTTAQDVPELAARMAVAAGAPMRTVYALWASLSVALMGYTRHRGEEYGIRWRRPDEYWLPETPDWEELAKEAGETVDVEAWKAYTKARSEERYGREK